MSFLIKTILALLLILVVGSYVVDSHAVSTALQAGQMQTDPLVTGAKAVKQEIRSLTDEPHREVYKKAVQRGLKEAVNFLDKFTGDDLPTGSAQVQSQPAPKDTDRSL